MDARTSPDEFKMSLLEHLSELRRRLVRVVIAVLVLGAAALFFARELYGLLMLPVLRALPPDASSLVYTSAIEEINVLMKIGLYGGVFLTTPVILWHIWGFVAPGLYEKERRLAAPFIVFGTAAFLGGAAFCYLVILPSMFQFLLQKEETLSLTRRLETARLHEEDALRLFRIGDVDSAAALARTAIGSLEASGDGQTREGLTGLTLVPRRSVDVLSRLEGLGRLVDAVQTRQGTTAEPVLLRVMEKRVEAVAAYSRGELDVAEQLADQAVSVLTELFPERGADLADLWRLERLLGVGAAAMQSQNWTRPMLSMSEQLTLVLVLELAFGVVFELPLVMMLLGMVGLVSSKSLFKYQRHALVVCLILAALITPTGDAVNLALMAGPMVLCYELGVLLVWVAERRRGAAAAPSPASS